MRQHSRSVSLFQNCRRAVVKPLEWRELIQGTVVSGTTGLAFVPLLQSAFGLEFGEAVTCGMIHSILLCTSFLFFRIPLAPGWITPVLPLVLAFVLGSYTEPSERFQAMTALSLNFVALTVFLGVTGLGQRLFTWMPRALKGGIVIGAAIAAFKRVFADDIATFNQAPIATSSALIICFLLVFSRPLLRYRQRFPALDMIASLGLLPGLVAAGLLGGLMGEFEFNIQWGFFVPEFSGLWEKASPFLIGWPRLEMYLKAMPLAVIAYTMLFADIVTGDEIIKSARQSRPDDPVHLRLTTLHHSVAVRNFIMAITAPFFSSQGVLWAGVQVVVVQRWRQGKKQMASLMGGIGSYYVGAPLVFFLLPVLTLLTPLMNIALAMTLALTGYACAYVAMALPKSPAERGAVLITGMSLVLFEPWLGLLIGVAVTVLLVGKDEDAELA
jgi:hypothetical protein